jgi:AcrR family transcriptional regulator
VTTATVPQRVDPRVRRTRQLLHDAVAELAGERPLADVSVGDIAERATVSRATFYLHYADRDALLADVVDALISTEAAVAERTAVTVPVPDTAPVPGYLVEFLAQIEANAPLFRHVLGPTGSAGVTTFLRERLEAALRMLLVQADRPLLVPDDVHAAWLAGALLGVIGHWLHTPAMRPASTVADDIWRLSIQPAARR